MKSIFSSKLRCSIPKYCSQGSPSFLTLNSPHSSQFSASNFCNGNLSCCYHNEVSSSQAPGDCRFPTAGHCTSSLFTNQTEDSRLSSIRCGWRLCELAFLWSITAWYLVSHEGCLGCLGSFSLQTSICALLRMFRERMMSKGPWTISLMLLFWLLEMRSNLGELLIWSKQDSK